MLRQPAEECAGERYEQWRLARSPLRGACYVCGEPLLLSGTTILFADLQELDGSFRGIFRVAFHPDQLALGAGAHSGAGNHRPVPGCTCSSPALGMEKVSDEHYRGILCAKEVDR